MKKCFFLLILSILSSVIVQAQVKACFIFQITDSLERDGVYLAGNFNNWKAKDPNYLLKLNAQGELEICFETTLDRLEFKCTRGTWESVEVDREGQDIPNRRFVPKADQVYRARIEAWKEAGKHPPSSASQQVYIPQDSLAMGKLARHRKVRIYLPPDYFQSRKKYPVLYMHDGQNLFDRQTAYGEEWGIDELLDSLFKEQPESAFIVVGIDNGGKKRLDEYSPWQNAEYGGGEGKAYLEFLIERLIPYMNKNYRVKKKAQYRGLMGSSMGGLISFYAGLEHPHVFNKIGVLSPSFWFSEEIYPYVQEKLGEIRKAPYFYFLLGGKEHPVMQEPFEQIKNLFQQNHYPESHQHWEVQADGEHQEWFWRRNFLLALKALNFLQSAGK